jgi:hypothetical protein
MSGDVRRLKEAITGPFKKGRSFEFHSPADVNEEV